MNLTVSVPINKPLLIFDGNCAFCRVWIVRWKRCTGENVDYAPSQEVASQFPDIPLSEFQRAVQLVEPDGRRTSGAEAVFRTLRYAGIHWLSWSYDHLPGFKPSTEFAYGVIAGHRPAFSTLTRWLWGNPAAPVSYRMTRWVFLRALAIVYGLAFWSIGIQIKALIGSQGVAPAIDLIRHFSTYGSQRFWGIPTLAWLNSSDAFLVGMAIAGVMFSLLLLLNVAPRYCLVALWALYLSIVSIGGSFMSFQWDMLLLEAGFLSIFFAPGGFLPQWRGASAASYGAHFLLKWLLFRLMIQSALVKWMSGDELWRQFRALTVHYQTQPLPNVLSWYVHHFPDGFHQFSCVTLFVIEGLFVFLIFTPRRARLLGFWSLMVLQILIIATGNYAFFNLLAIALCLLLLDDTGWRGLLPRFFEEPIVHTEESAGRQRINAVARRLGVGLVLVLTLPHLLGSAGIRLPRWAYWPTISVAPLRSFNSYGLFAVMTPTRPEIIIEGSNDGTTWKAYEFHHKPGDLMRRPDQVAPHQPRLDWQMWFAALSDYQHHPWFLGLCARLLQGSKPVLSLLASNPFPDKPPLALRAMLYEYRFSTPEERKKTGQWWERELKRVYCPVLSLKKGN